MLKFYRWLPHFKGKLRLGRMLFKNFINQDKAIEFTAHQHIRYKIPNTMESLGVVLMITGIYEKKVLDFLKSHIRQGDTYFDIGANIGAVGLPIVKSNKGIKYVGFEASPMVFDYLDYNFKKNKITNYTLHNYLVHEDDNRAMKFYQSEQYGKSSLAPTYTNDYIQVNSTSMDFFCKQQAIHCVNWMKVDVQGFELYVFKGMQQLLTNRRVSNILFEFEFWAEEDAGLVKGAAQQFMIDIGYELFNMNGEKLPAIIRDGRAMICAKPASKS